MATNKTGSSPALALFLAVIGVVIAAASVYSIVPRVRLVEAVGLAASSFGAGAAFVAAIVGWRKGPGAR